MRINPDFLKKFELQQRLKLEEESKAEAVDKKTSPKEEPATRGFGPTHEQSPFKDSLKLSDGMDLPWPDYEPGHVEKTEILGQNNPIKLIYLKNGVILLENFNQENKKLVYDKFKQDLADRKYHIDPAYAFSNPDKTYSFSNKPHVALIPRQLWEAQDYKKGMEEYCKSGQYLKDIIKTSSELNIPEFVFTPIDNAFKSKADLIGNKNSRYSAYFLYGFLRTTAISALCSVCPIIGAEAGSLYLFSTSMQIIFDFNGLIEGFKNSRPEDIAMYLGVVLNNLSSLVSKLARSAKGSKKISIDKNGKVSEKPMTKQEIAATNNKFFQYAFKKLKNQKNPKIQDFEKILSKATSFADKIQVIKLANKKGFYKFAADNYLKLGKEALSAKPLPPSSTPGAFDYEKRLKEIYKLLLEIEKNCSGKDKQSVTENIKKFENLLIKNNMTYIIDEFTTRKRKLNSKERLSTFGTQFFT